MHNKNKKNIKGFALVLSIVLLLVMSLMSGTLVVITSSDHKSNNFTDHNQQAFYVAETGLLEGEKYLINTFMGLPKREIAADGTESKGAANSANKGKHPSNVADAADDATDCYKSFKNVINLQDVVVHHKNASFLNIVRPAIVNSSHSGFSADDDGDEMDYIDKFKYEYFIVNVGVADFTESGSSIASGSVDIMNAGTAYRIYACGIYEDTGIAGTEIKLFRKSKLIIPLESLIILPG